jgi:integrase
MPRQHRHDYAADLHRDLLTDTPSRLRSRPSTPDGRALHPGPYPPDLSRCLAYGALPLVPVVYRLISLAGPNPSGSTRPSRLCQRCFPPSPTSPGSGCAPLLPGCCDSPARRHSTSFNSERLTAHQRLTAHRDFVAHHQDLVPHRHHRVGLARCTGPRPGLLPGSATPNPLPRYLPPDADRALQAALRQVSDISLATLSRLHADALLLTRATGLRIGELRDLELDCVHQINGHDTWLKVPLGKLASERMVPLDEETVAVIDRIVARRTPGRPLPHPRTGRPVDVLLVHQGRRLSACALREEPARAADTAGLGKITPHALRHTFATALEMGGLLTAGADATTRARLAFKFSRWDHCSMGYDTRACKLLQNSSA